MLKPSVALTFDVIPAHRNSDLPSPGGDRLNLEVTCIDHVPYLFHERFRAQLQPSASLEDAQTFKSVAYAVGRRAARLSAVALGAIVLQSGKLKESDDEPIDIRVDGSLVEHYPFFRDMIYEALAAIEGIGQEGSKRIRIGIAKDGSGVGAALIALVAAGMEKKGSPSGYFAPVDEEEVVQKLSLLASAAPNAGESTTLS